MKQCHQVTPGDSQHRAEERVLPDDGRGSSPMAGAGVTLGGLAWPFVLWALIWGALFWKLDVFLSGFHLIDDHRLIDIHGQLSARDGNVGQVLGEWFRTDLAERRFRPLYYASRVVRVEWLGLYWPAWVAYNLGLATMTSGLLTVFGLLLGFSSISSLTFAALTVFGPPSTVWWRLGTPETEATALAALALCLFAWAARKPGPGRWPDVFGVAAAVLASLTKEGMILFLPALAAMRVWLSCRLLGRSVPAALRDSLPVFAVLGIVASAELTGLLWLVGSRGTGYAGVDAETFRLASILPAALALARIGQLWVPAAASVFAFGVGFWPRRHRVPVPVNGLWLGWAVFLIGAIPQVLLYAKSGWADHYWNPILMLAAFIAVLAVESLRPAYVLLYVVGIALLIQPLNGRLRWTREHLAEYGRDGAALGELLAAARHCAGIQRPVILVANPRAHYEEAISLRTHLRRDPETGLVYLASIGGDNADIPSTAFAAQERKRAFLDPAVLGGHYFQGLTLGRLTAEQRHAVGAVVLLEPQESRASFRDATATWLDIGAWTSRTFSIAAVPMELLCAGR
ncbi:hypothetical protein ACW73L_02965 [Methylolobus aquaticus]